MSGGSCHDEIDDLIEKATAATALNAVYVLAQWVYDQGHPDLAERMRTNFIITEKPDPPPDPAP